ncbi:OLC1v1018748C1 [Oldenlandia corymbosa var. corymbosa]|uniref:OLC1v1018748C1 n=1 Tax=Oldenlandia corymbosa var. corymbosa TaxID=529605 RepID=A0AAV1ECQ1_OLDCO|nr:OLC1v1018748C1 [Oldenlandia corymbosa var. corymbosa]
MIIQGNQQLTIDETDVEAVLGLPRGRYEMVDYVEGKGSEEYTRLVDEMRITFGLDIGKGGPPANRLLNYLVGGRMKKRVEPDPATFTDRRYGDKFKRWFVIRVVSSIFWRTRSLDCRFQLMNSLINVDQIKELKWCEYIITTLKFTVLEWKRNPGHYTGPLVFVVVMMINDMGPLLLKLGKLFEEAKSAGISSQSELARLFFNYTKTINNMVVETAKAPDNVNEEQRNEGQQQQAENDNFLGKGIDTESQLDAWCNNTIKSTASQSKVVQPKVNETEGLNTVEKKILESVIQGATTNYSTPQKVNDSTGDNTNQQSVSEEEIKEYIDRKKQDQRKKREELKITDKSSFWKNGGNGIKGITEIERLISNYAFADDNDIETLFEMPGEDKEPRVEYYFVQRHQIKTMMPRVQISNEIVDAWAAHLNHLAPRERTKYPNIYFSSVISAQMPSNINKMPSEKCFEDAVYRIGYELQCQNISNSQFDNAKQRQKDAHQNKLDKLRIKYLTELLTSGINTKSITITERIKEIHTARNP